MLPEVELYPGLKMTRPVFEARFPAYTFAADGIVSVERAPKGNAYMLLTDESFIKIIKDGPLANIDHHHGKRMANDCAMAQTVNYIKKGYLDRFFTEGRFVGKVIGNHADMDFIGVLEALERYDLIKTGEINSAFYDFIRLENKIDITGGFCPCDTDSEEMETFAWLSEPSFDISNGKLKETSKYEQRKAIEKCDQRLNAFLLGKAGRAKVDTTYAPLYEGMAGGMKVVVVEDPGPYALMKLHNAGADICVALRENGEGACKATIVKRSDMAYSLEALCHKLNIAERKIDYSDDCWGGANNRGGSPRGKGSKLSVYELRDIISSYREGTEWEKNLNHIHNALSMGR